MNAPVSRALALALLLPLVAPLAAAASPNPTTQLAQGCPSAADSRRGTVAGTVADPSGARLRDARVVVECGDFRAETRAGDDGSFSIQVPPGTLTLGVEAPGFDAASQPVTVEADATVELSFALRLAPLQNVVTITDVAGYTASSSTGGTKTDTPLLFVPQAVSVVTRQLLEDQGVVRLDEALKNVAGVMPGGYYQDWDYYRIRGFDASFTTYVNGVRGGNGLGEEPYGLETVEVLKGPSSSVYGQGNLGGIVNLQSKHPRRDAFATLELTGGSYGFAQPAFDIGSSLNDSETVYGRLTALFRTQDSFVDYVGKERIFVAPALTWEIGNATSITFLTRYQRDFNHTAFPLPAVGTVLPNVNGEIPISRYTGEPGSNQILQWNAHLGYQFSHQFGDDFTLRQNLDKAWYNQEWNSVYYNGFLGADQRTLFRYPYNYEGNWNTFDADQSLESKFKTGSVRHNLLTGFEVYRRGDDSLYQSIDFSDLSGYVPLDVFSPTYGGPAPALAPWIDGGETFTHSTGLYIQDQARITDRLVVTAGGRFEFASNGNEFDAQDQEDRAFTPRVGVSYEFLPGTVAYASYSRSFDQQFGRVFDGSPAGAFVEPERGVQFEVGLKSSFLDGRVNTTLAAFNLTRENVITTDPLHPNFYLLTGEQRSRGFEFETTTRVTDKWLLTSAYAFTDAEVTEDTSVPVGTRTINVPRHSVNVWTSYELPERWIEGLGVNGGVRYYTDQSGDLLDTFSIPSYGIADAALTYRRGRFRGQVNLYNITNERYFTGSYDALYVQPGEPRTVRASIGWTF